MSVPSDRSSFITGNERALRRANNTATLRDGDVYALQAHKHYNPCKGFGACLYLRVRRRSCTPCIVWVEIATDAAFTDLIVGVFYNNTTGKVESELGPICAGGAGPVHISDGRGNLL